MVFLGSRVLKINVESCLLAAFVNALKWIEWNLECGVIGAELTALFCNVALSVQSAHYTDTFSNKATEQSLTGPVILHASGFLRAPRLTRLLVCPVRRYSVANFNLPPPTFRVFSSVSSLYLRVSVEKTTLSLLLYWDRLYGGTSAPILTWLQNTFSERVRNITCKFSQQKSKFNSFSCNSSQMIVFATNRAHF